jgi:hypothetical protein
MDPAGVPTVCFIRNMKYDVTSNGQHRDLCGCEATTRTVIETGIGNSHRNYDSRRVLVTNVHIRQFDVSRRQPEPPTTTADHKGVTSGSDQVIGYNKCRPRSSASLD